MGKSESMEYEKVIDYINQLICSGELGVGSKLPTERSIAETLGIGRNSTREALSILHGMGTVSYTHLDVYKRQGYTAQRR